MTFALDAIFLFAEFIALIAASMAAIKGSVDHWNDFEPDATNWQFFSQIILIVFAYVSWFTIHLQNVNKPINWGVVLCAGGYAVLLKIAENQVCTSNDVSFLNLFQYKLKKQNKSKFYPRMSSQQYEIYETKPYQVADY